MRNKFFSLILGLMVILVAPALIQSCTHENQSHKGSELQVSDSGLELTTIPSNQLVCTAGMFAFSLSDNDIEAVSADSTAVSPEGSGTVAADDGGLLGWQNILIAVLGIFSALFAGLWKRARNVITAIDEALKDGKVDKVELNNILKAWKG